jgi:hypothetical protein
MTRFFLYLLGLFLVPLAWGQTHTVGLISYVPDKTLDGYMLLYPQNQSTAFLMNNCGEVVHTWVDNSTGPSNMAYLQPDGTIFMAKMNNGYVNPWITGGGGGQKIEHRDWDNNLLWQYEYSDSLKRMHHDFTVLPNGNVVLVAWERKLYDSCIVAGRDSALMADGELWPDHLIELQPTGLATANIVWEWHAWDHLIQDYNNSLPNYGVVADHPELINLNYINGFNVSDWLHFNTVDYNAELDQLVVSSPTWNEVWIIDHSTTTAEAAGHNGGNSGKGGDLIYRWGNPEAYGRGDSTDRKLGFQHDIHWMDDELPPNHPDRKKLMVFNNRMLPGVSAANIIAPVFDTVTYQYQMLDSVYLPATFDYTYTTPNPATMFSAVVSSAMRLPNGNTFICAGRKGYTLEVDSLNEIVWEYKTPFVAGLPVAQGTTILPSQNLTFRTKKYSTSWPGFNGHSLIPSGYIELNPDSGYCSFVLAIDNATNSQILVYPNPVHDWLQVTGLEQAEWVTLELVDLWGKIMVCQPTVNLDGISLNLSSLQPGIYFLNVVTSQGKQYRTKILKE